MKQNKEVEVKTTIYRSEQAGDKDTHVICCVLADQETDSDMLSVCLREAADCLKKGGLVAFPTETVYGLGADALNETAARRIYEAKGRPSDNPLIVHVASTKDVEKIAVVNDTAKALFEAFWPGPLTVILPKKENVPDGTTGGLNTVAVRMPSHPAALELIRQSGVFVAAPSANISGRPSPTKASHVIEDMCGKVEYIVDGGPVGIGIESTIVDVSGKAPMILRPGFISKQMLEQIIGEVHLDPTLTEKPLEDLRPKAPGMKYTHYAPKGEMTIVESDNPTGKKVMQTIIRMAREKRESGLCVGIMASTETLSFYYGCADAVIGVGNRQGQGTVAAGLYAALRDFDKAGVDYIYAESFRGEDLSDAIMNRLLKAAGHRIVKV